MNQAYIALGTNIEPRQTYLKEAITELGKHESIQVIDQSSIYQTVPVGYLDQADFLNMVIAIKTSLPSLELLDVCQTIEHNLGRERGIRFGPRTIDLDILVYNDENIKTERLTVPHPRMYERAFVLVPLLEIAPNLILSKQDRTVKVYLDQLSQSDLDDVKKLI